MPELPEVETVRRSLEPGLYVGAITGVETSGKALRRRRVDRAALRRALVGARFVAARRHGKYLLLDTDRDASLLVHLGMSGRLLLVERDAAREPHTHVDLALSSGRALRFVDPRRFGAVRLYERAREATVAELATLGPDPLGEGFSSEAFVATVRGTRRDLKSTLMDQRVVAGLGNIYVSEALFEAGLSPRRRGTALTREGGARLYEAIHAVLRRAVANRGTSFSDYVDAEGRSGDNQLTLSVYGREGQACRRCGEKVRRIVQQGRSTYYCRRCQAGR